jgi:chromosome segregation ATPase
MSSPALAIHSAQQPFGFTRKLRQSLIASQSQLNAWAEEQKAEADAAAAVQQAEIAERQDRVDQCVTNLLALDMEQGMSVSNAPELQEQRGKAQKELDDLKKAKEEKNTRLEGKLTSFVGSK